MSTPNTELRNWTCEDLEAQALELLRTLQGTLSAVSVCADDQTVRERAGRVELALRVACMLLEKDPSDPTHPEEYIASKLRGAIGSYNLDVVPRHPGHQKGSCCAVAGTWPAEYGTVMLHGSERDKGIRYQLTSVPGGLKYFATVEECFGGRAYIALYEHIPAGEYQVLDYWSDTLNFLTFTVQPGQTVHLG
jgi:hypothetical protein